MAKEFLAISEDYLKQFIIILKKGIVEYETSGFTINPELKESLIIWCKEEEEYLEVLND